MKLVVNCRLDEQTIKVIKKLAKKDNASESEIIRKAVEAGLMVRLGSFPTSWNKLPQVEE